MYSLHLFLPCVLFWLSIASVVAQDPRTVQYDRDGQPGDPGLANYISRPDLRSPKWNLTVHDESLVSPGYWFVAPYRGVNGEQSDRSWVGPCIYDGNGELVWSGGPMFSSNVEDFRLSNINGEQVMTLMASSMAHVLNDNYTVRTAKALETVGPMNTHELNFIQDGTRAIFLKNEYLRFSREASLQSVGFDGECIVRFDDFAVLDVTKQEWPQLFEWHAYGNIGLDESSYKLYTPEWRCKAGDFFHANSVDRTPDGDYLYSARHTDTIYKISGTDGSIIWRLGGIKSDFTLPADVLFSRQHDVRFRNQNGTHIFVSILDNAKGQDDQPSTHDFSRGLLLAIDEKNRQVSIEAQYDHPYRESHALVPRRGNYQVLPNGNVFMGWSERALHAEYTPDGKLIWDALLQVDWMGTYRSYKFDGFVGKPAEPPVAVSKAYDDGTGNTVTEVHVSWNGATEVCRWDLYKTSADGETMRLLADSALKNGFETVLRYHGYAAYIVVEAIDEQRNRIGNTSVVGTLADGSISPEVVAEEEQWLRDYAVARVVVMSGSRRIFSAFCAGVFCGVFLLFVLRSARQFGAGRVWPSFRLGQKYTALPR